MACCSPPPPPRHHHHHHHHHPHPRHAATAFASLFSARQRHGVSITAPASRKPSHHPCARKCAAPIELPRMQNTPSMECSLWNAWRMDGAAMDKGLVWWLSRSLKPCRSIHRFRVWIGINRKMRSLQSKSSETFSSTSELGFDAKIKNRNYVYKSLWQVHQVLSDQRGIPKASSLSQLAKETTENECECEIESDGMASSSAIVSRSSLKSLASSNGGFSSEESSIGTACAASMSALKGKGTLKNPLQGKECSKEARNRGDEAYVDQSRLQQLILGAKNRNLMVKDPTNGQAGVDEGRRLGDEAYVDQSRLLQLIPGAKNRNLMVKDQTNGQAGVDDGRRLGDEAYVDQSRLQQLIPGAKNRNLMVKDPTNGQAGVDEGRRLGLRTIQARLEKLREAGKRGLIKGTSYAVDPDGLIPGEYVVHKKVGIGRFVVLKDGIPEGKKRPISYVYLRYADGMAKLPAKQAHRLLYRYNPVGETCKKAPALNKLHDTSLWESKKSAGKLAIQKLVVTMVEQTVRRLKQTRSCYPKNDEAIADFAALFKHMPTPDQQQAFCDVEEDMTELESPMDRLICGDVGFGKTEIALRAIFIALDSGKQSMVLAPTTVLAKQHYEVISDRFSSYSDVKVALLTRFQKGTEKRKLFAGICDGSLNIIVGTHGLLSDQVQYGNLGLLVVDEEQRFGVKQKEKIASLKSTVDVLTLSATPIPRTLYMALNGFRDVSLLTTPPLQRLPIVTRISEYSDEQVKDAIEFELERGGQVFYVVPRIKDIEHKKTSIMSLFPDMEVCVAHGQQTMSLLEGAMEKFSKGEGQILLCTSIVESGLDIPRVNTIIIEDAQLFGLAQLYQLRGRVGRGELEGHAYMFHPPISFMGNEALQRLNAVKECCGLGQGFQLAEKDMTIRGIGSVFTEKQSGDMSTLGVDLYAEMLFESLSNEEYLCLPQVDYDSVQLDMDLELEIPSSYIASSHQRDLVIKEAHQSARDGMKALMKFTTRLRAEFGSEPPPVQILLKKIYVRKMAADLGIHRIVARMEEPVHLETTMHAQAFAIILNAIASDSLRHSMMLKDGFIQLHGVGASTESPLDHIFSCLSEMRNCLPSFIRFK